MFVSTNVGQTMIVDRSADEEKDDAKAEWSKVYEAIFAQTDSTDSSAKN